MATCIEDTPIQNLAVTRENDRSFVLTVQDADGNSLLVNGTDLYFTVKQSYNDSDADKKFQVHYTFASTKANATISLTDLNTDLDLGTYVYDILFIDANDKRRTILKGNLCIQWRVTDEVV